MSETEMADVLRVSRTPVREAFIRLAEDGLLDILPQRGSKVSLIDLTQAQDARFIRLAVEREVLKEACSGATPTSKEWEANLRRQQECYEEKTFDQLLVADNEFHRILYRACGKERIWDAIKRLDFNYDRLRIMTFPSSAPKILQEHQEIVMLVKERRASGIEDLLSRHLTWKVIEKVVFEYPEEYFTSLPDRVQAPAGAAIVP